MIQASQARILVRSQDYLHRLKGEIQLLPYGKVVPVFRNDCIFVTRSDIFNNLLSLGLANLPLARKREISMDIYLGYWTNHTHVDPDNFWESFMLSTRFSWDISIISEK